MRLKGGEAWQRHTPWFAVINTTEHQHHHNPHRWRKQSQFTPAATTGPVVELPCIIKVYVQKGQNTQLLSNNIGGHDMIRHRYDF